MVSRPFAARLAATIPPPTRDGGVQSVDVLVAEFGSGAARLGSVSCRHETCCPWAIGWVTGGASRGYRCLRLCVFAAERLCNLCSPPQGEDGISGGVDGEDGVGTHYVVLNHCRVCGGVGRLTASLPTRASFYVDVLGLIHDPPTHEDVWHSPMWWILAPGLVTLKALVQPFVWPGSGKAKNFAATASALSASR